jgi:hypothetical protein
MKLFKVDVSKLSILTKLRPARDWESLNCRLVTQQYKYCGGTFEIISRAL